MKLIIQPENGAAPLIKEIDNAKKSIEIAIFRFDHVEIQRALERAVDRGVSVHALIANTNHGEEENLRKLEMDLLPMGVEVSRTADDLLRHHYKFMIVDRRVSVCLGVQLYASRYGAQPQFRIGHRRCRGGRRKQTGSSRPTSGGSRINLS